MIRKITIYRHIYLDVRDFYVLGNPLQRTMIVSSQVRVVDVLGDLYSAVGFIPAV